MRPEANLVIQTAFLGDLILSVPTFLRIKKKFPDKKLVVVCRAGVGEFLLRDGIVDTVIEVIKSDSGSYAEALESLRQFDIENLYCLHRSARSILFSARIPAKRKIGFSSFLGFWVFDDNIQHISENHEVLRQMKILESTDEYVAEQINSETYSYLNNADEQGRFPVIPQFFKFSAPEKILKLAPARISVFPGSVWNTKKWTAEGYTELCRMLAADGFQISLLGGPAEEEICREIADKVPGAEVLAGKMSIAQSIDYIRDSALVICNDSASTHMAAYNAVPVVAIFGPTTSAMGFRPWNDDSSVIENTVLSCRPCGRHGHKECPLGHHLCMKSIDAKSVYNRICRQLQLSKSN